MSLRVGWTLASMTLGAEWTLASEALFSVLASVTGATPIAMMETAPVPVGVEVGVEMVGPSPALAKATPLRAWGPHVLLYSVTASVVSKMSSPFRAGADPHGSSL